jgi:hypothetical protein
MAHAAGRVLRLGAATPTFDAQFVGEHLVILCILKELAVLLTRLNS